MIRLASSRSTSTGQFPFGMLLPNFLIWPPAYILAIDRLEAGHN